MRGLPEPLMSHHIGLEHFPLDCTVPVVAPTKPSSWLPLHSIYVVEAIARNRQGLACFDDSTVPIPVDFIVAAQLAYGMEGNR
jgi:hypothetical protein